MGECEITTLESGVDDERAREIGRNGLSGTNGNC